MVTEIEPLPNDVTADEWLEDSRRIKDEWKREMKHELHVDGLVNVYGSIEAYMMHVAPEYRELVLERFG